MAAPTRIVERLRLRAGSQGAVRRAAVLLADAFRTASLPDAGARVLIVRSLRLGHLGLNMSPQALSLLVESRFATGAWTLVHGADAHAGHADAVWFRDCLEACQLAASRAAAGRPIDAWFWRLAVPAVTAAPQPHEALRAIAFFLASRPEAPAALPAWTASLVADGHEAALIAALHPGDGPALLRAAHVSNPAASLPEGNVRGFRRAGATHADNVVRGPGSRIDGSRNPDDRVAFVTRMLEIAGTRRPIQRTPTMEDRAGAPPDRRHGRAALAPRIRVETAAATMGTMPRYPLPPDRLAHDDRAKSISAASGQAGATAGCVDDARHQDATARTASAAQQSPPLPAHVDIVGREHLEHTASRSRDDAALTANSPPTEPREARAITRAAGWPVSERVPTAAGGLLFLVPVLARLGFADWCSAHDLDWRTSRSLATRIFATLLDRLRLDPIDPAWMLTGTVNSPDEDAAAIGRSVEADWRDDLQRFLASRLYSLRVPGSALDAAASPRRRVSDAPDLWLAACRRLLRTRMGIGPASLVRRTAHMVITPTHVDLFFRLADADDRVRRAGLDITPGWVPWLAAVVTIHYAEREWK